VIKVEKGVPVPKEPRKRNVKYPWREMEVGDSFYTETSQPVVSSSAILAQKRTGMRFTTKREGTGTRVWRIE